ncbi:MAG: diguanylate cyclase [Thermoleophilia bacterium]|nr:diguanylate cyclase [Thermoleophilia bacterium]
MPTVHANDLPAFLSSSPARTVGWIAAAVVLGFVLQRIMRPHAGRDPVTVLRAFGATLLRITLFAVGLFLVAHGLFVLAGRADMVGSIARNVQLFLHATSAYVAGLFLARQFTAPPWWRLNAWDPSDSLRNDAFGITDAFRWIADDVREHVLGMRLVDRLVVLGAIPLAMLWAMQVFGATQTLLFVDMSLLVLYVALVVALFSANRIPRVLLTRLQDLRQVARRIARGDLSARVGYLDTAEYEELGELVADFNSMARALQSREQENHALTQQLNQALQFEQERASRDPLTQLRNHRYFQEALAAELYRCSRTGELTTIAIIDLDDFKAVNDTYGHQEGDAVLIRTAHALTSTLRPYDLPARLGGEEFGVIFPSTAPEEAKLVMDRIMQVLESAGPNSTVQTFSGGIASFPIHAQDQSTLYQLADSSAYAAKMNGKKHTVVFDPGKVANVDEDDRVNTRERDAQLKAARTLVQTVDMIEGFGNEHSENVGRISAQIAQAMGCEDSFSQQMYLCGLLHDVGKLGLEQSLMQKAGRLTPEEFEQVKRHPDLSAQIVMNAGLGDIASWVRHHHEHWDGSGYPLGLQGHDIPLGSRIVLVAEAFDVMTSDRPYRQAMSLHDATQELLRGAGSRFDPDVVGALVHLIRTGEVTPGGGAAPGPAGFHRAA